MKETYEALKNGDHKAFEAIFLAYYKRVKYFILGLVKSEEDAEELAQEVFVKLWTNRTSINVDKNLNTFIYVMARNMAFNFLKSKLVRESYSNDPSHTEETSSSEDIIYARETELLIKMTVNNMPERRKEIYKLSRDEGLTNDEIAAKLNISTKTVENQLSLALKELRKILSLFILFFL